jgi:BASS family bile acid:Na+ symporter
MRRFFEWFNNLYPLWLVMLAVIVFFKPPVMLWFTSEWIFWSLAASMLGMGLTLSVDGYKAVGRMPGSVALGLISQYTIMPLAGWATAKMLHLETGLAVGIILVASCPGGMASNIISYLARANVALSVVLTLVPVVLSVLIRWKLPRTAERIGAVGPTIAVIAYVCLTRGIAAVIWKRRPSCA